MTQSVYKHLDGGGVAELRNFLIGTGSTAPTKEKAFQYRNGRLEYFDGTTAYQLATVADINAGSLDVTPFQIREAVTLASLPANTATLVKPTGIKTISSYLILDGTIPMNGAFDESFVSSGTGIGLTLTSLVAKSNLTIIFSGIT